MNAAVLVKVRPTVNPNTETIENVVAKLQQSHIELLTMMVGDFETAGVHRQELYPLRALIGAARKRSPEWFCQATNFLSVTNRAFKAKQDVFTSLHDATTHTEGFAFEELGDFCAAEVHTEAAQAHNKEVNQLYATAELCAKEGAPEVAAELLARSMSLFCVEHENKSSWDHLQLHPRLSEMHEGRSAIEEVRDAWEGTSHRPPAYSPRSHSNHIAITQQSHSNHIAHPPIRRDHTAIT